MPTIRTIRIAGPIYVRRIIYSDRELAETGAIIGSGLLLAGWAFKNSNIKLIGLVYLFSALCNEYSHRQRSNQSPVPE